MHRLEIPGCMFESTPIWWQNFIHDCRLKYPNDFGSDFRRVTTKILKEEYHASKIYDRRINDIEALAFDKEEYKTWFVLRWS
jgi:hypothetical protein